MRSIKVIFLLAAVSLFVSVPFDVQAKDCSAYKKLSHKWLMCKGGSDKYDAEATATTQEAKAEKTTKKENCKTILGCFGKEKKSETKSSDGSGGIKGIFKKIKEFGGKNIGSEG